MKALHQALGAAAVAAAIAVVPGAASGANDTVVRLEYQADAQGGCVGQDELRRMVTDQLGHDPFRPDADRRLTITIARTETGFQGRIVWTEADGRPVGERVLSSRGRDCREIAANVAFAAALQVQLIERSASREADAGAPDGDRPPPQPGGAEDRARDATAQGPAAPAEPSDRPPAPAPAPRLILALGAGPAVGVGMAPEVTAFGRLFVVARLPRWSAEIAADASLPTTEREANGTGAVVNAMGSSAAGCAHLSIASLCMLGRLGWIRARGTGVNSPSTSWARFGELGMRVAGTLERGRFIVSVHADGLVMLSRWNVVLNDTFVVWTVPRVGAVVGLDVALRFF